MAMSPRINLADPTFEPTDEDLAGLMRASFAGLAQAREQSLREMRRRIELLELEAIARFDARARTPSAR